MELKVGSIITIKSDLDRFEYHPYLVDKMINEAGKKKEIIAIVGDYFVIKDSIYIWHKDLIFEVDYYKPKITPNEIVFLRMMVSNCAYPVDIITKYRNVMAKKGIYLQFRNPDDNISNSHELNSSLFEGLDFNKEYKLRDLI